MSLENKDDNPKEWLDDIQKRIVDWAARCFGTDHVQDRRIRGLRLLEEAIEFAQSVYVPIDKVYNLVYFVYARPVGKPEQELGGVGLTMIAAAHAVGVRAADVIETEILRVESKPIEHFQARNKTKCDAGFSSITENKTISQPAVRAAEKIHILYRDSNYFRSMPKEPLINGWAEIIDREFKNVG